MRFRALLLVSIAIVASIATFSHIHAFITYGNFTTTNNTIVLEVKKRQGNYYKIPYFN